MDRTAAVLIAVLECAELNLTLPVCKAFVHSGPNAPWDSCEIAVVEDGTEVNGQLWVAHLRSTPDWPLPTGVPKPCPTQWTAELELGIARCQQAQPDDEGNFPPADVITADAALQQVDRYELMQAITCCLRIEEKDVIFDYWEAFEPSGGCVASRWRFRVRVGQCKCDDVQS